MDILSPSWSELGMEDPFSMDECQLLNTFDEYVEAALQDDYQNSFFTESNSSSSTLIPTTHSTAATAAAIEAPPPPPPPPKNTGVERPTKQRKPNSYKSCAINNTPKFDKSSSASFILNFANSNIQPQPAAAEKGPSTNPEDETDDAIATKGGAGKKTRTRPPSQTYDHIIAERKRREQISQRFVALSAIVPGLKKMDKSSVLGDAINYMKQLQERVKTLEEQSAKQTMESVVLVQKSQLLDDDEGSSVESSLSSSNDSLPEIEARTCGKSVLLKIHCEKRKGVLVKLLCEIEKMNLAVINTGVSQFGSLALDITIIAEMEKEFRMTVKDIVRSLRSALQRLK